MRFEELAVAGAFVIEPEPIADERGSFARVYCARTFAERGLDMPIVQTNLSRNRLAGTLRGMHFQRPPHAEAKLVRCVTGALFDVVLDIRPDSPTYGRWAGRELRSDDGSAMYVPAGCAHGFQTLEDDTVALYEVSAEYAPDHEGGIHHADPAFGIVWPTTVTAISDKDARWQAVGTGGAP